jgi:glycine hydroxymethyltransferase
MHVIAAKAVAFNEALGDGFKHYQQRVINNARTMANILIRRGLRVVSGGTDCHMFLLDLRSMNITGKDAEALLESAHITLNKNAIPDDPQKPAITSGIRIGTPALTTRGFGEAECAEVANLMADLLEQPSNAALLDNVRRRVMHLCECFPVYLLN